MSENFVRSEEFTEGYIKITTRYTDATSETIDFDALNTNFAPGEEFSRLDDEEYPSLEDAKEVSDRSETGPLDYFVFSSDGYPYRIPAKFLGCNSNAWDKACEADDEGYMVMTLTDEDIETSEVLDAFLALVKDGVHPAPDMALNLARFLIKWDFKVYTSFLLLKLQASHNAEDRSPSLFWCAALANDLSFCVAAIKHVNSGSPWKKSATSAKHLMSISNHPWDPENWRASTRNLLPKKYVAAYDAAYADVGPSTFRLADQFTFHFALAQLKHTCCEACGGTMKLEHDGDSPHSDSQQGNAAMTRHSVYHEA